MDTQNTPVHIKLWHKDFWRLCFANLLLMSSVYMLIIAIPYFLIPANYQMWQIGCVLLAYGFGLFLFGGFCSYLVQRYRRNMVCQLSILGVVVCLSVLYYLDTFWNIRFSFEILLAVRFLLGAFLGLAQMSLASTLVIDSCESFQRTEANYITSWFARFSIAVGPLAAFFVYNYFGMGYVFPTASLLALGAFVLVSRAKFPFKAPAEGIKTFSLDRFYLPQGTPLFVNIILITFSAGLYFSLPHSSGIFLMIFGGLVLAFLAEKFVFADADLKSQIIVGLILLASAELISFGSQEFAVEIVVPTLLGFSLGIIGSRFLLFYIKLAKHCQRGTSVNSFFLAWELGLSLGLGLGFLFHNLPARAHFT
jgi:MFS family permease